jgi:hypothetical protein
MTSGGTTTLAAGSTVTAAGGNSIAGTISVTGQGLVTVGGLVAAGPSTTLTSSHYSGELLNGGNPHATGGSITLKSTSHVQPGLIVTGDAILVTQGNDGTGTITLEGCDVRVLGLVASLSDDGSGSRVVVRSGTSITVDGRDVNGQALKVNEAKPRESRSGGGGGGGGDGGGSTSKADYIQQMQTLGKELSSSFDNLSNTKPTDRPTCAILRPAPTTSWSRDGARRPRRTSAATPSPRVRATWHPSCRIRCGICASSCRCCARNASRCDCA